jgi:phosphoribosyl 1,2-cyclic phosphodiesterase
MDRGHDNAPALCVLASGSSGNCSVLRSADGELVLIDAGLSPKRVGMALAALGHALEDVAAVVLTHLDSDHFYGSWATAAPRKLGRQASVWVHASHARERRLGPLQEAGRLRTFERESFEPVRGMAFASRLASHDAQGVATFRISFSGPDGSQGELGFLTDLGEVTDRLVDFHAGVGVLAIESNYCPRLQARSARPDFLKRRIMGGAGHLSNEQCLCATEAIGPASHAVFLHLSRECNSPEIVGEMHEGANYARTIASAEAPTRWVAIEGPARPAPRPAPAARPRVTPLTLFGPRA